MLNDFNPLVQQFRQTTQDIWDQNHALEEREIFISTNGDVDHRRYNAPTGLGQNEVAGIMPGSEDSGLDKRREIRIRARGNPNDLHFISDAHKFYYSLHFVLFHPRGEQGWEKDGIILLNPPQRQRRQRRSKTTQSLLADEADEGVDGNEENDLQASDEEEHTPQGRGRQLYVSELGYAAFFMQDRNTPDHSLFIYGKKLFQEWLVDQFCKIESRRLLWVRMNQKNVRSDLYQGLADALAAGDTNNLVNLGEEE